MKLTKGLFLAFAGLGLFACSNEEVTDNGDNGIGGAIVSVNIVTDGSRATYDFEDSSTGGNAGTTKPVVIEKLMLKLEAGQGGKEVYFPITNPTDANRFGLVGPDYDDAKEDAYFSKSAIEQANSYLFTGVRQPSKLTLSINDGVEEALFLPKVVSTGLATPMYEAVDITADMYREVDNTYHVSMQPAHRLARLEFSEISHLDNEGGCWFETINISGLFLNKVKTVEGGPCIDTQNIYNWESAQSTFTCQAIENGNFKTAGAKWPTTEGNCYAYNVFPAEGDDLPVLTLYFTNITMAAGQGQWAGEVDENGGIGYATVKDYVLSNASDELAKELGAVDGKIVSFKPGYVYRFTKLAVPDKAIGGGIDGGKDVNVIAEVEVLPWKLVDGTVTWN